MISTVKAVTFIKVLSSGRTRPCLMLCEDHEGNQIETVVKLRVGKESTTTGLVCELLGSLLADDLDLIVPTPFLVDIDADFHSCIPDATLADRFRKSTGLNFGSRHLGSGYTTWPQERSIPASLVQVAAEIFAFDLMIQNPDRLTERPNLLRKGDEIAIFDHEMAFSFLYSIVKDEYSWLGKGMNFSRNHIFYGSLKGRTVSWERLQGALEAIDDTRLNMYNRGIPDLWRQPDNDAVARILEYLRQARNNSAQLFQRVREVLL